ncbi:MAG: tRNA (adenosine(37)-N6)-threonylcarbamoyltransferase complex transferase subunit TsaD [Oscillospiraceae bacterium]|nr:tRNA (adenosine(37)-N6)-threonylcarbamoyltransferase complex transferase subunit TsaD [Oscillospiraceae bacterium]
MKILAIETSCDETSAAIVENGRKIISLVVATQIEEHRLYGGVVPEIASRRHCESICQIVDMCLKKANLNFCDIDAIAVTFAPGLIGALLVGVNYAKGLSLALKKPLIPVHHLRSHIASNYLTHFDLKPPFLSLIISGGHSHIVLVKDYCDFKVIGRTKDDAVGEAYDKVARALGFPYPGGIQVDKASVKGNPLSYHLPRPSVEGSPFDFSFSGLKTAVLNILNSAKQKGNKINDYDLCASFQLAVCDLISSRVVFAAKELNQDKIVVAGGVSANSGIRKRLAQDAKDNNFKLYLPDISLCGDNAAMVASQAYYEFQNNNIADMSLNAIASLAIDYI